MIRDESEFIHLSLWERSDRRSLPGRVRGLILFENSLNLLYLSIGAHER